MLVRFGRTCNIIIASCCASYLRKTPPSSAEKRPQLAGGGSHVVLFIPLRRNVFLERNAAGERAPLAFPKKLIYLDIKLDGVVSIA